MTSLTPALRQQVLGENTRLSATRQALPVVTGTGVVLTGNTVVVGVETIRVKTRTAVPEEEELGRSLSRKVSAVLVAGRRAGRR